MKTTINAQIVAHSVNEQGDELISVLATFPRIILAEVNTHRMLSKNTSSSRAIPFHKMVETIQNDPFIPVAWQKEHKGMQGSEYFTNKDELDHCIDTWLRARDNAITEAQNLSCGVLESGTTKQLCNRLLEPFMWTTMLITGPKSGWDNFFKLRCPTYEYGGLTFKSKKDCYKHFSKHYPKDAEYLSRFSDLDWLKINKGQAEIHMMALAECIWDAVNESIPKVLKANQWHIPFENKIDRNNHFFSFSHENYEKRFEELSVQISVAMAARTSYTVVGEEKGIDYEAMIGLHNKLLAQDPPHSSPLEHCAKAMSEEENRYFIKGKIEDMGTEVERMETGYSQDVFIPKETLGWCNNFKGFIPYRYMVDNGIK